MHSKIGVSSFQYSRQPVLKYSRNGDDHKLLSSGDTNINHSLSFIILAILPGGKKLFGATWLSEVGRNDNADSVIRFAFRLMNGGTPDFQCIPCHEKLVPISI